MNECMHKFVYIYTYIHIYANVPKSSRSKAQPRIRFSAAFEKVLLHPTSPEIFFRTPKNCKKKIRPRYHFSISRLSPVAAKKYLLRKQFT